MFRNLTSLLLGVWLVYSNPASARDEALSFATTASGNISVTLFRNVPYCQSTVLQAPTTFELIGNRIAISATIPFPECTPPPTPEIANSVTPMHYSVNVGSLADGEYEVTWVLTAKGLIGLGITVGTATDQITIRNGNIAFVGRHVPTLPLVYYVLAASLLSLTSFVSIKRGLCAS